ncbi:TIR domain-containing protein [Candidatus Pantoea rara]
MNELVTESSTTHFAVFVFQPDDLIESRGKQEHVVRDNVLFELG